MPEFRVIVTSTVEDVYYVTAESREEAIDTWMDEEPVATHYLEQVGDIEIEEQDDE